jgi:hypothetical protein
MTESLFQVHINKHIQMQHRKGGGRETGGSNCNDFNYLPENEVRGFLQNVCTT